jgi:hypothetical protein
MNTYIPLIFATITLTLHAFMDIVSIYRIYFRKHIYHDLIN